MNHICKVKENWFLNKLNSDIDTGNYKNKSFNCQQHVVLTQRSCDQNSLISTISNGYLLISALRNRPLPVPFSTTQVASFSVLEASGSGCKGQKQRKTRTRTILLLDSSHLAARYTKICWLPPVYLAQLFLIKDISRYSWIHFKQLDFQLKFSLFYSVLHPVIFRQYSE